MQRANLEGEIRVAGKEGARKIRAKGLIPAVLYGKDITPVSLAVDRKKLEAIISTKAGMNVLIDLSIKDGPKSIVRIKDYQADPIEREFTHLDFQTIDLKKKIMVGVPVQITGKSEGVKEGGILLIERRTLELRCIPTAIPENIIVDIGALNMGDAIHIDELKLPEGVECPHETNFSVVSVVAPKKEEVAAPPTEAVPVEVPAAGAPPTAPGAAPGAAPPATAAPAKAATAASEGKK